MLGSTPAWQGGRWYRLFFLFWVSVVLLIARPAQAFDEFLDPEQAFQLSVAMHSPTEVDVHFQIAPEYYMYQSRFAFSLNDDEQAVGDPAFPPAQVIYDPTFDEEMAVFREQVTVRVPVQPGLGIPGLPLSLAITYQGCADAGLCYSPMTETIQLTAVEGGYKAQGRWVVDSVPEPLDHVVEAPAAAVSFTEAFSLSDTGIAGFLAQTSWAEMMALAFVFGLLLSFTPCVLPMVPILLSIIAGQGVKPTDSRWRGLTLAAAYVLGMSLVYTALGVAAGLAGASLAAWLQTPWVLSLFAVILAVLALSMFDVYNLQVPAGMQSSLQGRLAKIPGGKYGGVFLMGMLSALIVGPCVAAPLAGVLLFISQTGDVVLGGATLFALAWGSGALLLVVGASSGALLPKAGGWMNGIKYGFGILLLATAWWMVNSVLPTWVLMLGWAVLAIWSATLLGAFRRLEAEAGVFQQLLKGVGILVAVWAIALTVGVASGSRSITQPLAGLGLGGSAGAVNSVAAPPFESVTSIQELEAALAAADRPVMLDFYADWCVSCIEMEQFTFTDPEVAQKMGNMILLQADVTKNTPEDRELLKRFHLFGPPGIIFFDAQGNELPDPRVVGFMPADKFSAELNKVVR